MHNNNSSDKKVLIVDGYSFVFRAFFAVDNTLTSPDGTPINAVFGFANLLIKLIELISPTYLCIAFDSGQKSFRNQIYDQYKANRAKCPEALIPQFSIIRELVESLGIKPIEKDGYEADDIIASMSGLALKQNIFCIIASSDKDLMQLIKDDKIIMYDDLKSTYVTEETVKKKFGIAPQYVKDYLSLVGDSSDNIPGATGIGPKIAEFLIKSYGNINSIYENIDRIENQRVKTILENCKQNVFLSQSLVSLDYSLQLSDVSEFKTTSINFETFTATLKKYGINSIANRVSKKYLQTAKVTSNNDQENLFNF